MSKDNIPVNISTLTEIINSFRDKGILEISTADLLREYQGGYHKNTQTAAQQSFNANFGKVLQSNHENLRIVKIESSPILDDNQNKTTSSIWKII